eukprot:gene10823-12805_t
MDDADFSKLAAEINAYLADMVVKQEADSGEVMSEGDVNKIKRSFFTTTALYSIFFSDDDATDKVRVYLLEPREDGSTVVGMIVEDTEEYHSNAGFMIVPLTYRRFQPFVVKASNGDVDYDAAWHALFYFLQLKFSGPSSTKAHHALKRLRIAEDEDPLGPSTRLGRAEVLHTEGRILAIYRVVKVGHDKIGGIDACWPLPAQHFISSGEYPIHLQNPFGHARQDQERMLVTVFRLPIQITDEFGILQPLRAAARSIAPGGLHSGFQNTRLSDQDGAAPTTHASGAGVAAGVASCDGTVGGAEVAAIGAAALLAGWPPFNLHVMVASIFLGPGAFWRELPRAMARWEVQKWQS